MFVGYVPGLPFSLMLHELVQNEFEVAGSRANTTQELKLTIDLVAQGCIRPVVDRSVPLEEVDRAHQLIRQGKFLGRAVLEI